MLGVFLALGAALGYAAASVLQHREAHADADVAGSGLRLVGRLARRPLWLAGVGADAAAYGFQAAALGVGALLVVQPVITAGLLFALPASARLAGRRIGRSDVLWGAVLAAGLAVFLALAVGDGGRDRAPAADWLVCALVLGPAMAASLVVGGRATGTRRAVLFALATGALFGVTAALTKATVVLLDHHGLGALRAGEPYALVLLGGVGFVLNQRAFQAGALTASLPTLTVVEPLVAAVIGLTMLDERVRAEGVLGWAAVVLSAVAMAAATAVLARSSARLDAPHEHELAAALVALDHAREDSLRDSSRSASTETQ